MAELSFEQMLENDESKASIRQGEIIDGTIIGVKPDEIVVDIKYKSDGIITRNEYTNTPNADLTELVKLGIQSLLRLSRQMMAKDRLLFHTRELQQRK